MKNYQCSSHKEYTLDQVCIDKYCSLRGLICLKCYNNDHVDHHVVKPSQFIPQILQKQCTGADDNRIRSQYQAIEKTATNLLLQIQESIHNFTHQIQLNLENEIQIIEQQRQHQKEQTNLLDRCYRAGSIPQLSKSYIDLIEFNIEAQIFHQYDEVRDMMTKNSDCVANLQKEGNKIVKDFQEYLKQILLFIGANQSDIMRVEQSVSSQDIQLSPFLSNNQKNNQNYQHFDFQMKKIQEITQQNDATFGVQKSKLNEMQSLNSYKESFSKRRPIDVSADNGVVIDIPSSPITHTQRINDFSKYLGQNNILNNKNQQMPKQQNNQQIMLNTSQLSNKSQVNSDYSKSPIFSTHFNKDDSSKFQSVRSTSQVNIDNSHSFQSVGGGARGRSMNNSFVSEVANSSKIKSEMNISPDLDLENFGVNILDPSKMDNENGDLRNIYHTRIHSEAITGIAIQDDIIITSAVDGFIRFTDSAKGIKLQNIQVSKTSISTFIKFEEKGQIFLAIGCEDGYIYIYQKIKDTYKCIQTIKDISSPVVQLIQMAPFNSNLFAFYKSGYFSIYNWITAQLMQQFKCLVGDTIQSILCAQVSVFQVSRKLRVRVITGGGKQNGVATVWGSDAQLALKHEYQWVTHLRPMNSMVMLGEYLVTSSHTEGLIKIWDTLNFKIFSIIKPSGKISSILEWRKQLYISYCDRRHQNSSIQVWNLDNIQSFIQYPTFEGRVYSFLISPKLMILGMSNGDLAVKQK